MVVVLALAALVAAVTAPRWLPSFASFLIVNSPLRHADAIVVLSGTLAERPMEAADLYHEGYAPVVVLTRNEPEQAVFDLARRGIKVPLNDEIETDVLVKLGVPRPAIIDLPGFVDNTRVEGRRLAELVRARHWRTIIVVTSKYHTRRAGREIRRTLAPYGVTVLTRGSRYDPFDPANWWDHRDQAKNLLFEYEKLLAYLAGSN